MALFRGGSPRRWLSVPVAGADHRRMKILTVPVGAVRMRKASGG
jgi:hypothetical protein